METTPRFIRGIQAFTGQGLGAPAPLGAAMVCKVASDKRGQLIYFRAGNSADALIAITLTLDGKVFRMFPLGAKAAMHVPLAVVEDLQPDSELAVQVAAPSGVSGEVVIDIGLIEI